MSLFFVIRPTALLSSLSNLLKEKKKEGYEEQEIAYACAPRVTPVLPLVRRVAYFLGHEFDTPQSANTWRSRAIDPLPINGLDVLAIPSTCPRVALRVMPFCIGGEMKNSEFVIPTPPNPAESMPIATLPFLTDVELRAITAPVTRPSAILRWFKREGFEVKRKPNGMPLISRRNFERVMGGGNKSGSADEPSNRGESPNVAGFLSCFGKKKKALE
jgi:hypothetical protein